MDNQNQIKFWYDAKKLDQFDRRINFIATTESFLAKVPWNPNTFDHEIWATIKASELFTSNKKQISITQPSMVAMYLSISNEHYQKSLKLYDLSTLQVYGWWIVDFGENSFDLLENIIVSIIFAVWSLETFFNSLLMNVSDTDVLWMLDKKTWNKVSYNKQGIEFFSVDKKIFEVLPLICPMKDMKRFLVMKASIVKLIKLRNRIVHLKAVDQQPPSDPKNTTIWKLLFDQLKYSPASLSKDLLSSIYESNEREYPRRLKLINF